MKYLLSSFGLNNPFIKLEFADHLVYPISQEYKEGLDLDYGMLLVGEKFLLDKSAYSFIISDQRSFLNPMKNSIKKLEGEGFLELCDVNSILKNKSDDLIYKTNKLVDNYDSWFDIVRDQWRLLSSYRDTYVQKYGQKGKEKINSNHYTLANALFILEGKLKDKDLQHYNNLLLSKRKNISADEKRVVKETLKPLICHLLIHELISSKTRSTILDWNDSKSYYDQLYLSTWDKSTSETEIVRNSSKLFNLLLPQVMPNKVDDLIQFLKDEKAKESLRKQIVLMLDNEVEIDSKWLTKYQSLVFKDKIKKEKKMKRVRFWTSLAGLILPGASLGADLLSEGAGMVVEGVADETLTTRDFNWYYAFQNNFTVEDKS